MRTYDPDRWAIFKARTTSGEIIYKVAGEWSGSYLYGPSWRFSSGIIKITETDDQYIIVNHSGSMYYLRKDLQGWGVHVYGAFKTHQETLGDSVIMESSIEEAIASITPQ